MITEDAIPEHWEMKTLGDVSSKAINGGTPKRSEDTYWNGGIPWLSSGEVRGFETSVAEEYITELALEESSAKLFPKNSVLVAMYGGDGTNGRATILREEMSGNQAICCLSIDPEICTPEYVWYYLQLARENLSSKARGGIQKNLNQSLIKSFAIPVPPLEEQGRIVERLEETFEYSRKINQYANDLIEKGDELKETTLHSEFRGDTVDNS